MNEWEAGPDDEEAGAVMRTVTRQLKLWREAAGLTQAEFGAAIKYGEETVSCVERGRRIPRPEYLDAADEVLGAGGKISAMKKDVAEVRYPKKVRDLKNLEAEAVELCAYNNSVIHGLLQIKEYAWGIFNARRPGFTEAEVDQQVEARLARQEILDLMTGRRVFSFVQCESTLRRPIGAGWCCGSSSNDCCRWPSGAMWTSKFCLSTARRTPEPMVRSDCSNSETEPQSRSAKRPSAAG